MSARIAMTWMRSITRLPSKLSQANCNYYSINRLLSVSGYSSSTRRDLRYSSRTTKLVTPCYYQAQKYLERVALVDQHATHTYSDLVYRCNKLTETICDTLGAELDDINAKRVTYLCPNDVSHVITQWGIWGAGGVAVPLSPAHPTSELEYVVQDTKCSLLVTTEQFRERMEAIAIKYDIPMITLNKEQYLAKPSISEEKSKADELREASRYGRIKSTLSTNSFKHKPSLIVYTSGTTGPPKGVVHTFGSIQAQIEDMVTAWGWTSRDVILHVLPLHHVHGIVNIMMTPLLIGATCVMLPTFDASQVWSTLLSSVNPSLPRSVNVFMAVPTIYAKLIEDYESRVQAGKNNNRLQDYTKAVCSSKIRLMVSGSAALPQPIMERWEEITGHKLLERYGMTEFGMGLTNPLNGNRTPGAVGSPFPQVEVCIAKPNVYSSQGYDVIATGTAKRTKVTKGCDGEEGELYVKGPNMFKEYLNKPDATRETFTKDGWFKTGDTACYVDGVYKILGRTSVDIIKSGGYKISALDIERHLLSHPDVKEAVVVGLPDMTWGQKVAAVLLLNTGSALDLSQLKSWARDKMPSYHIPSVLKTVENIPRNAMGKVNKKELVAQLFAKELKSTRS